MLRAASTALLIVGLFALPGWAEVPRQITWESLVPDAPPLEDPLDSLPERQRGPLLEVGWIRQMEREGRTEIVNAASGARAQLTRKLEKQGVDVEGLLDKYDSFLAEVTRRGATIVGTLDQQLIRMPGYALALEFSGTSVKEFLLVPYVGACIHVPPPPPNQMVYVRMPAHKTVTIGWWDPVVFEGVLHIKHVDSPFGAVAYEMDGVASTPYKPKKP